MKRVQLKKRPIFPPTKPTAYYDDEAYGPNFLASTFIEDEEREPQFTGVLSPNGLPIIRMYAPKPAFGFPIYPEDSIGQYDLCPDTDYMYCEAI